MQYKSWIEISRSNLLHNFNFFRKMVGPKVKIAGVVKANAYGHGLKEIASLLKNKADWFAVDHIDEALSLRLQGVRKPILILGYTLLNDLKEAIENNISLTIYNKNSLKKIVSLHLNKKAKIHLKVETGFNRQGLLASDILDLAKYIRNHPNELILEGLSTHFAAADLRSELKFFIHQLKNFTKTLKLLENEGFAVPFLHCAATASTILHPGSHFGLVRVGLGLYGLWPKLKPVLSWKTIVVQVKEIKRGETVSYGRTWKAEKDSKIAIIPVGYSDGYDRKLSNNGRVIIKKSYAPVIGRVAMNMTVVDVTNVSGIAVEDEVILIGKFGDKKISADELANRVGTINYEIVARINSSLPRVVAK